METKASAKYIRVSARKARLVVDLIRGKDIAEAQQILDFSDKAAARVVLKILNSAIANAEHNNGLSTDDLFVSRAYVDEGPTLKRFRPRAMGRATRINKRTSHITVVLDEREQRAEGKRRRLPRLPRRPRKAAPDAEPEAPLPDEVDEARLNADVAADEVQGEAAAPEELLKADADEARLNADVKPDDPDEPDEADEEEDAESED